MFSQGIMQTKQKDGVKKLIALVKKTSKHSGYQLLHPWLGAVVENNELPTGKNEAERQAYMHSNYAFSEASVLDIGANTGYFSFGALEAGASYVTAVEGNAEHAEFIHEAAKYLGIEDRLIVRREYFDFESKTDHFDLILCLNVLHHLGDDFGSQHVGLEDAKTKMSLCFRNLARTGNWMWFQLGYNWKGNRHLPLFQHGLKSELIEFIVDSCQQSWAVEKVAIFDPTTNAYADIREELLVRFDDLGEFLNRPLFLLRSLKTGNSEA